MFNCGNSKVTLELREVLSMTDENGTPFVLWDFDYPSFYEGEAKKAFEQLVIDHYLFHQIGTETVGRFKHNFKTRIREIMPYYIQYYKSVETMNAIDDPFGNVDIVETFEQETTGSSTGSATSTSSSTGSETHSNEKADKRTVEDSKIHKFSNTPQGSISNIESYMSEGSVDTGDTTDTLSSTESGTSSSESGATGSSESSDTSEGTVKHTLTRKGNQGVNTYAHDMIELRQSFINVDMMVIGALRDLFLMIY